MKTNPLTIILVVWWQNVTAATCIPKNRGFVRLRRTYLGGCYEVDMYRDGTAVERLYLGGDYYKASSVLVKEGSSSSIYYILRDYLGSITGVADSNGKLVEEYSYDAWGNRRDHLVQNPDMPQNHNSYSYCVNNPLKYTDPEGEFFLYTIFTTVTDFFGNIFSHGINFGHYNWKRTENALKIDMGMFKGNILQIKVVNFQMKSVKLNFGILYYNNY